MTDLVRYDVPVDGVARVTLNRPDKRNAQNVAMLYALNAAFDTASRDDDVRAIVLDAEGPDFSAGHDVKDTAWPDPDTAVGTSGSFGDAVLPGWVDRETEIYLDLCQRWRDLPKPTVAAVQGRCIGGGLMLAWVCDLIVASDDATFSDPVVALGANGVEWFVHAWELGHRKAKEFLLTGQSWDAREAYRLGMVNRVVPAGELGAAAMGLASAIAAQPPFAARLAKQSVNRSLDRQGQGDAVRTAFALHQLCHAHNWAAHDLPIDPGGLPDRVRISGFATYQDHLSRRTEA